MTRAELWEMTGRGELRWEGGGGGEDVKSILNTCFFLFNAACKGIFVLKRSLKKWNGQVLNKPQMRLLLKSSRGTFYQIQSDVYI